MNTLKKYVEYKLTHSDKVATAEGYPLTMQNCKANKRMKQLEIYGNTVDGMGVGELVTDVNDANYGKYKIPVVQRGKNFLNPSVVSALEIRSNLNPTTTNTYGTTIDFTDLSDNKITITQVSNSNYQASAYQNGYFCVRTDDLIAGNMYKLSFDVDIVDNPLSASSIQVLSGGNWNATGTAYFTNEKQRVSCTFKHKLSSNQYAYPHLEIRCMGMSFTASNFMITETDFDDGFEPYVEPIISDIILSESLGKADGYADYVDFKNKKAVHYNDGIATEEPITCELPKLTTKTTIIEVDTSTAPSNMYGKYIKK